MIDAMMKGISTSISTSSAVNRGVRAETFLYCFTCLNSVFIISLLL